MKYCHVCKCSDHDDKNPMTPKASRWMNFVCDDVEYDLCGGGLFIDGKEHDACLVEFGKTHDVTDVVFNVDITPSAMKRIRAGEKRVNEDSMGAEALLALIKSGAKIVVISNN